MNFILHPEVTFMSDGGAFDEQVRMSFTVAWDAFA